MVQRILILGTDNFVGRRLFTALEQSDWAAPRAINEAELVAALKDADGLVSCVTGDPKVIVSSAQQLFAATKSMSPAPRVVLVSSMTVYGSTNGVVDESAALIGDLSAYAAARVTAEQLAKDHSNVVTLRPGCEYGPQCPHWSERIAQWLLERRLGDLGAHGDGICNLLYIDDLVAAIVAALRIPEIAGQAFNLASAEQLTWNDYFVRFAKALNAVPVKRISQRRLQIESKLLAPPLKILELALGGNTARKLHIPAPLPPSFLRACTQELRMNVSKAETQLGLTWLPLATGLQRAAAAFLQR